MKRQGKTAFTLPELMVVITIIGLLAAIIMPFFQRAFAAQRAIHCKNNLEKIGQAYYTKQADDALAGARQSDMVAAIWPMLLAPYASDSVELFHCTEDPKDVTLGESALEKLCQVYVEVYQSGAVDTPANVYWKVPLDESYSSEYIWRLSEEQFLKLQAAPGHGQGYKHPGYQAGANPDRFYFTFEDQGPHGGGDMDFWDQMLRIDIAPDAITITPISGAAGYNFTLIMLEDDGTRKTLIRDLKQANGQPYEIPGGYGVSSYGMNSVYNELFKGERKLLVLDYETPVASGSTYARRPDPWLENPKRFPTKVVKGETIPQFFRHFTKANVLLADGTVHSKAFDDITIYQDSARQEYWDPARPRD